MNPVAKTERLSTTYSRWCSTISLSQVADFLCTVELTAVKCENHDETNADLKMFDNVTEFKKGYLRHLRKKQLA